MPNTTEEKTTPIFGDSLTNLSKQDWPKKRVKRIKTVSNDKIKETAQEAGFSSREAKEPAKIEPVTTPKPVEQRRHRTGRNQQLSLKVRDIDLKSFTDMCDEHDLIQGYAFQLMLELFQQDLASKNPQTSLPLEKG